MLHQAPTASPKTTFTLPWSYSLLHKPQSLVLSIAHKNLVKYVFHGVIFLYVESKQNKGTKKTETASWITENKLTVAKGKGRGRVEVVEWGD